MKNMSKRLIVIIFFLVILVVEYATVSFTYNVAYETGRKAGIEEMVNIIDSIFTERVNQN